MREEIHRVKIIRGAFIMSRLKRPMEEVGDVNSKGRVVNKAKIDRERRVAEARCHTVIFVN